MPEDMLKSPTNEQEKNTSEKPDALLPQKQDILQAFGKDKNDQQSLQILEDVIKPIKDNIDQKTADSILQNLSKDKEWIQSLNMNFEDFIKNTTTFIDKKILNFEDISISDMKTYIESNKNKSINSPTKTNLEITQEMKLRNEKINKGVEDIDNKERQLDEILSSISEKLTPKTSEITSLPTYQSEKATFEQQLGKKVDDGYFVTRFALGHIGEPNAYLTQADLGGIKQEDLLARLNEKYGVNEVISLQDKTFKNNQFDGRVSGEIRQEIATKGGTFETVFTAAELEFFKKDSQLRNNLHGLVQGGIFADAKGATNDKPYWNGEKDGSSWIPQNALQNEQQFSQWIDKNQLPSSVKNSWTKYYTDVYKKIIDKPQSDLSDAEKALQKQFLQNLAIVESTSFRNTVQETSTKIIAENLFTDIAAMTGKGIEGSSDWKLIKPNGSSDYFSMDADGNVVMQYELHGVKGDIAIDKNGVVTMGPVLGQEKGYSDIIATKRKVGQINGVVHYVNTIDAMCNKPGSSLKNLSQDRISTELRKSISRDTIASDVTKATMQTHIARQSLFDTVLSKTNTPRTNDIKLHIDRTTYTDKPLIKGIDTDDFSRCMVGLLDYTKTSSASQIDSVTNAYNSLQQYLATNASFSESVTVKKSPEHLTSILNKFPIEKWGDIKTLREKQYKEEKNKADIDNELAALEKKIDNNFI